MTSSEELALEFKEMVRLKWESIGAQSLASVTETLGDRSVQIGTVTVSIRHDGVFLEQEIPITGHHLVELAPALCRAKEDI